ncbi:MAG TPA: hypothetical protein VNJ52_08655 [Patescibacteria group bacterium]|nr:hypothetical protein [Patescibacteria group bacterium]
MPCVNAQIPSPVVGASAAPVRQAAPSRGLRVPVFEFRSGFWVNLHHFLYLQARLRRGLTAAAGVPPSLRAWDMANLSALAPSERQAWQKAVDYYAENFAGRDLPYDSFLVRIDDRLSDMAACPDLIGRSSSACASGIDPALAAILEEAAPVYRAHWWNLQNRTNRAWISQTVTFIRRYGSNPAEALSQAFQNAWPAGPIPVDVVPYAGAFGAYTTLDPLHIVLASGNPRNQGFAAGEVVFREASHVLAEPVEQAIVEQCREQTKPIPRDLWHAIASYTTAMIFERSFTGQPLPPGVTLESFAESNREYIVARGWQSYQHLLKVYWQPYLYNETGMQSAITGMVNAL